MTKDKRKTPLVVGNHELAVAMQEKRRSNAAGTHADRRTHRVRSRAAKKAYAIQDAS
jgi:hypothetical protein